MSERYTLYENGPTVSYEMTNPIIDSTELRKTIESNLNNIRDDGYERRRIWRRMLKRNEKKSDLSSKLLASVVNQIGNAQHLIKDYENWLGKRLIKQIAYRSMTKTVGNYTFKLTYDNMNIIPPTTETGEILYPAIARIRSLTYSVKVMIDVTLTRTSQQGGEETIAKIEGIMIADIPIMMGSKYDRVEKTIRDKIQEMKESERVLGYTGEVTPYSYIDRYKYAELVQNVMSSMGESPLDIPGYFIVEGASKIIKSRDNIKNNIFFIDTASIYIDSLAAVINCTTPLGTSPLKVYSKYRGLIVIYMQLSASKRYTNIFNLARSLMYGMGQSTQVRDENGEIVTITQQIDVSDMDNWFIQRIYQHCGANKDLLMHAENMLKLTRDYVSENDVLTSMAEMMQDFTIIVKPDDDLADIVAQKIKNAVYPQIEYIEIDGVANNLTRLETFVYHVYLYIAASAGYIEPTNRDDWSYKRIDTSGRLLELLYGKTLNPVYKQARSDFKSMISEHDAWFNRRGELIPDAVGQIEQSMKGVVMTLRSGYGYMATSLSTTSWGVGSKDFDQTALIDDTSRVYRISQINILSPKISKYGANMGMRVGHKSGRYIYDIFSIRENMKIGQEKEKSLTSAVSVRIDGEVILHELVSLCTYGDDLGSTKITGTCFYNGINLGRCNVDDVELRMKRYKRVWKYRHITIMKEMNTVVIGTDAGRTLFPAIVLQEGKVPITDKHLDYTLRELVENGLVEYLDPGDTYIIADSWDLVTEMHTHVVIHPAQAMSFGVLKQAFSDRSDPVRVAYGGHMMRGIDETRQVSTSIQRAPKITEQIFGDHSLVSSVVIDFMNRMTQDSTVLSVFVDERGAYNAEDALVMSKAAVQRNAFAIRTIDTVKIPLSFDSKDGVYHLGIPPYTSRSRSVAHLNEHGLPKINSVIKKGDIIIGRYLKRGDEIVDMSSISVERKQRGIVNSVSVNIIPPKGIEVTIQFLKMYATEQGRKFAHSGGQKGVTGRIEEAWDLPYIEKTGRLPDVVWNGMGHRRSTISLVVEQFMTSGAYDSRFINVDGTPYNKLDLDEEMHKMNILTGIKRDGRDYVIDQTTGIRKINPIYHSFPALRSASKHDPRSKYQASSGISGISALLRIPTGHKEGNMKDGRMTRNISAQYSREMLNSVKIDGPSFDLYFCTSCGMKSHTQEPLCFTCNEATVVTSSVTGPMSYIETLLASKGYIPVYRENV